MTKFRQHFSRYINRDVAPTSRSRRELCTRISFVIIWLAPSWRAGGQDEANPVFWLAPERARWAYLSPWEESKLWPDAMPLCCRALVPIFHALCWFRETVIIIPGSLHKCNTFYSNRVINVREWNWKITRSEIISSLEGGNSLKFTKQNKNVKTIKITSKTLLYST